MIRNSLALSLLAVWLSTALAVGAGLYFTHDMRCLWFMVIPLFMNIRAEHTTHNNEENKDEPQ